MAVWGSMDGKDHTGSEWSPCATKRTSRAPGCQDVALKLGVNYRTRDSITGNPALGRLPGDLPPELPQDPPSIDDITGTFDLSSSQEDAMDRFEGAANSRRLAVRRQHDVRAHDRSVDHVPVPQIRGRGPTLLPREPAATSAANKNTASPDAVMTWPLVSGTIKFPTSQQSATTADPALAKLTAGSSPSFTLAASPKTTSAPQTAAPAKTKAASSVFCSMHNQVRPSHLHYDGPRLLMSCRILTVASRLHSVFVKAARRCLCSPLHPRQWLLSSVITRLCPAALLKSHQRLHSGRPPQTHGIARFARQSVLMKTIVLP